MIRSLFGIIFLTGAAVVLFTRATCLQVVMIAGILFAAATGAMEYDSKG
jgi:hypothetical protein